jgi:hypothetical protein
MPSSGYGLTNSTGRLTERNEMGRYRIGSDFNRRASARLPNPFA